jgi:hypothetical protein
MKELKSWSITLIKVNGLTQAFKAPMLLLIQLPGLQTNMEMYPIVTKPLNLGIGSIKMD